MRDFRRVSTAVLGPPNLVDGCVAILAPSQAALGAFASRLAVRGVAVVSLTLYGSFDHDDGLVILTST